MSSRDSVNHPSHYNHHPSGVECVTIAEHYNFKVGNAIKYLWRAGLKVNMEDQTYADLLSNNVEDLRKAEWYIRREIERLTNTANGELKS